MSKISVLLSLYKMENALYFDEAMQSIWFDQKLKPDQVVLVIDGPITDPLQAVVDNWVSVLEDKINVIKIPINKGLANALKVGLTHCKYDFIARMDTDDISLQERFCCQKEYLMSHADVDVVGSMINEIDESGVIFKKDISLPLSHNELFQFFSTRDPLFHPTVMFRKTFFDKAGSYESIIPLAEDTHLWYKGFKNNCVFANIPNTLLNFRRSSGFYKRRSDRLKAFNLLSFRISVINKELKYGLGSNIFAFLYFLMAFAPGFLKKLLYNFFR